MTLPDAVATELVEVAAEAAFMRHPENVPDGWPTEWSALPAFLQHDFRQEVLTLFTPTFPVIERYSGKGWESAAVLLGRIEMLIADWKHRDIPMSPHQLAAELQIVLDSPMEN